MIQKLTLILLTGLLSQTGFSQTIDKTRLDNYFQALEANNKFMGTVAISRDGKLVYTRSTGFSNVAAKLKANDSTKYRVGSISKTFTTVLVFKAIEERKLNLAQTIGQYFPAIKNLSKITIGQLLGHRSGIHNFTDDEGYLKWNTQKRSEKEMIEIIRKGGSDFEPGSKAEYSNSNFVLLSYILQKVYKKSYSEILKEKIIQPAGLMNTFFGSKINLKNNESYSYKFLNDWVKETETDMSIPMGAGSVVSTPTDLVKFADALFTEKIIKLKSIEQMKTMKDKYGMGLFEIPFNDKIGYGHTGGIDGFTSVFAYFPQDKIAYALTSNGTNYDNNNISIAALSWIYGKTFEVPDFKTYELSTAELDSYLGVYSSTQIPLKITITKSGNTLMAQATGQSAFGLEAVEKDKFKFDQAGVVMEFTPADKKMILKQGGGTFTFAKE